MTERDLGNSFSWWVGKVTNVKDPDQSGRVQVRVFGRHDDEEAIPDSDLPWAMPLQPVMSAAFGKVGIAPLGLLRGSKVIGFWADADQQLPVIMGSFGKSGDPLDRETFDGAEEVDTETGSIPAAATNQSPPIDINPYSTLFPSRVTINQINDPNADPEELVGQYKKSVGIVNRKKVDEKLKEPTAPTTASAENGKDRDPLDVIKAVDPTGISSSLPNMVQGYMTVRGILSLTSPQGLQNMLSGALSNVIGNLANSLGLGSVLGPLMAVTGFNPLTLSFSGQSLLPANLQGPMMQALGSVIQNAGKNGGKYKSSTPPASQETDQTPKPPSNQVVSKSQLGPFYVQQFYAHDKDPYPGYIEWRDSKTGSILYTRRNGEPNYLSANEKIQAEQAQQMSSAFQAAINRGSAAQIANTLSPLLTNALGNIASAGLSAILGNGVNASSVLSLATQLLPGGLGGAIQGLTSGQLPLSVLGGSIAGKMADFALNQAILGVQKSALKTALEKSPASAAANVLSGLSGLPVGALTSVMSGSLSSLGLSNLAGNVAGNLASNLLGGGVAGNIAGNLAAGAVSSAVRRF